MTTFLVIVGILAASAHTTWRKSKEKKALWSAANSSRSRPR